MDNIKITIETNAEQAGQSFEKLSKKFKDADNSAKDLRKEIRELKNELFTLTPGTEEYSRVLQELGMKMDELQETTQQLRAATGGLDTVFQTTTSAVGSLAAGFTAASGVVALFGGDTEDLQKTFVKLQAVMAIMTGLKGFSAFTKESKKAWISLKTFTSQSLLATKAVIQQTTATSTLNATQKVAAVSTTLLKNAFNSLTAAIASNPFGAVLVALTAVIALVSKFNKEANEAAAAQKQLEKKAAAFAKVEASSYSTLDDYYQHFQTNYESVDDFYDEWIQKQNILESRLKAMGVSEEKIMEIRRKSNEQLKDVLYQTKANYEEIKAGREALYKTDPITAYFTSLIVNSKEGAQSLMELDETISKIDDHLEKTINDINSHVVSQLPDVYKGTMDKLKQISDVYKVDMAAGVKTQGDYLKEQIKVYDDAIDNLWDNLVAGTPQEIKEFEAIESIFRQKRKELQLELDTYNAGERKKAADEAKKAAEALNKNFKKLSTDISDKADEYKEAWEKALKGFADMGNFADDDLLNGNQSMARALTELNRYTLQLDEYCDEWIKGADKALKVGEITQSQYDKLVKHVKATKESMVTSMKESLGAKIPDTVLNAGMEVQKIVENFKKQNDRMLEALAGGLVSKEEYADFLVKRTQEYKQEIADKMPELQAEIQKAIEKAAANNEDTTALEEMYNNFETFAQNLVPPAVVQQINASIKEVIDKEFSAVEREYDAKMNDLLNKIHKETYAWLYGDDGNIKSGESLMMKLLFGQGEDPKVTYDRARKQAEQIFNATKEAAEAEMETLRQKMELLDKNSTEYQQYAEDIIRIQNDLTEAQHQMEEDQLSAAQDYADRIYDISSSTFDAISGLASAMGSYYAEQAEQAKETYGENSEEYQKYLKKEGAMKIAQVWSDWATGVMAAWAANAKYGVASYVLAALQTAALTATAIASTQQIKRQTQATASGSAPTANVSGITDRVIMGEAQNADQTAQLNADYSSGATRVYVTQSDLDNGRNTRNVAVTQNTF